MNPADRDDPGDEFAEQLAELDEQLAAGPDDPRPPVPDGSVLDDRLQGAAECLRLMEHIRREFPETPFTSDDEALLDTGGDAAATPNDAQTPDPAELPANIGRFQLVREIGSGGYGVVFLAVDPELDRQVALKVPRPEVLVTAELRQRFLREARAAAALSHPNVVPLHEAGQAGPIAYIASAYCEGPSLSAWLKQRDDPVPIDQAAGLTADLADAVQHAHSRGVLHRDLKPSNVLLEVEGSGDSVEGQEDPPSASLNPLITDFGLARIVDEAVGDTKTGDILGTPSYMAPEQAEGRHDEVGTATDVYALGAILYELLTGRPPFRKESMLATLEAVRNDEPTSPRRLREGIPRDLEAICQKCLEKQPEQRYASSAAVAEDLRHFLSREPVTARPLTGPKRFWRWCKREPLKAALVATVVLALLSITAVSSIAYAHVSGVNHDLQLTINERDQANLNLKDANVSLTSANAQERFHRQRAEKNFRKAREAVQEFLVNFGKGAGNVPHMTYFYRNVMERALTFHRGFLDEDPSDPFVRLDAARAHRDMGLIYQQLKRPRDAEQSLNNAVRLLTQGPAVAGERGRDHAKALANSHSQLALLKITHNRLAEAEEHVTRASALWQRLLDKHPSDNEIRLGWLSHCNVRANLLVRRRRVRESLDVCKAAQRNLVRWKAETETESKWQNALVERSAQLHVRMAGTYELGLNDRAAAARHLRQAADELQTIIDRFPFYSSLHRQLSFALSRLGALELQQGHIGEAETAFRQARDLAKKQAEQYPGLPGTVQSLARSRTTLGGLLLRHRKKYADAAKELREAADLHSGLIKRNPNVPVHQFECAAALVALGVSLRNLKRPDECALALREAIGLLKPLIEETPDNPRYHYDFGSAHGELALAIKHKRAAEETEQLQRDAVQHLQKAFALQPRNLAYRNGLRNQLRTLTLPLAKAGKHDEVLKTLQRIADLKPRASSDMMTAAQGAAAMSQMVRQDKRLSAKEQDEWSRKFADAAMRYLKSAVAGGLRNAQMIARDPLLEPLRNRKDFSGLLKELKKTP